MRGMPDVHPCLAAQAALIRPAGRGSPAEDTKGMPATGPSVLRGWRRASLKHRARDAGETADLRLHRLRQASVPRGAGVRGSLGTPAFRAPSIPEGGGMAQTPGAVCAAGRMKLVICAAQHGFL